MTLATKDDPIELPVDRSIAFLDILGFANLVTGLDRDPKLFRVIRGAMEVMRRQSKSTHETRRSAVFSDTIVLSDEREQMGFLLLTVRLLVQDLLCEGVLCRGSVLIGKTHHSDGILFGSGIVEAYRLESKVAFYPRIILDDEVAQVVASWPRSTSFVTEWKDVVVKDSDGIWIVDAFAPPFGPPIHAAARLRKSYLSSFRRSLVSNYQLAKDRGADRATLAKAEWAIGRFNSSLTRFELHEVEAISA